MKSDSVTEECMPLQTMKKLSLNFVFILTMTYYWYQPYAPEYSKTGVQELVDSISLIEGNIKHAIREVEGLCEIGFVFMGLGNLKVLSHYIERASKKVIEAIEDMKASCYQWSTMATLFVHIFANDADKTAEFLSLFLNMGKKFPNTKDPFPIRGYKTWLHLGVSMYYTVNEDWDTDESFLTPYLPSMHRFYPPYRTFGVAFVPHAFSLLNFYEYKKKKGDDVTNLIACMKDS